MTTRLHIDDALVARHPEICVGGFVVRNLDVAAAGLPDTCTLVDSAQAELVQQGIKLANLAADPRIAGWRKAIQECGLKAKSYKSSPEQLARRVLQGKGIVTPLPVVDAYCAVSTRNLVPLGGYDRDRLPEAMLRLRLGNPGRDRFTPLGGNPADMPITDDVAVYAAGDEVLCWAFNFRDSANTCLTKDTRTAVFLGEATTMVQQTSLRAALVELAELLAGAGAVVGDPALADGKAPELTLEDPVGTTR
ncbi:MAG: phenylalanine--tRNA ligase beta subunit-related protein [Planctomycetota bacterium]